MRGNHVLGEAAVLAGCRFYAGYPITPQNEVPEYLSGRLPQVGGVFIQGESEIAS
ncbi:MAG TPA: 3-methyl-2-oxobutanoate dehydrogenase subunit beta, partial [Desulfobacterales bacterium]|nr:3-methyl-2-oxobutanoate dehydrogenase subunit beta [Desulfobacterales bacterium]